MNGTWFAVKAKYFKIDEKTGKNKKVSEYYLLDALTFIEAETRINKELEPYITGEFSVTAVKISNIDSVIENESDYYYKVKISLIAYNEETSTEKRKNVYQLVQAGNVKHAYVIIEDIFSDSKSDYEILSIDKTQILDIFHYEEINEDEE